MAVSEVFRMLSKRPSHRGGNSIVTSLRPDTDVTVLNDVRLSDIRLSDVRLGDVSLTMHGTTLNG